MVTFLLALLAATASPAHFDFQHEALPPAGEAEAIAAEQEEAEGEEEESKLNEGLLAAFEFRSLGPAFMSVRIADIAVDPVAPNTWYVAAG